MVYIVLIIIVFLAVVLIGMLNSNSNMTNSSQSNTNAMNLSQEATMLVAFTKKVGHKSFFDKDKTEEQLAEDKYNRIMEAGFLLNRFFFRVKEMNANYRLCVTENGPVYGKTFEVTLGSFLQIITGTLTKQTESLPKSYQEKVDEYMRNPLSDNGKESTREIESRLFSKHTVVKKYADAYIDSVINTDFMYTLFE